MHAKRGIFRGIGGIVPGAGGKLDDALPDVVGHADTREARAAFVEQPDDVAVADATRGGIGGMQSRNLAATVLAGLAVFTAGWAYGVSAIQLICEVVGLVGFIGGFVVLRMARTGTKLMGKS